VALWAELVHRSPRDPRQIAVAHGAGTQPVTPRPDASPAIRACCWSTINARSTRPGLTSDRGCVPTIAQIARACSWRLAFARPTSAPLRPARLATPLRRRQCCAARILIALRPDRTHLGLSTLPTAIRRSRLALRPSRLRTHLASVVYIAPNPRSVYHANRSRARVMRTRSSVENGGSDSLRALQRNATGSTGPTEVGSLFFF